MSSLRKNHGVLAQKSSFPVKIHVFQKKRDFYLKVCLNNIWNIYSIKILKKGVFRMKNKKTIVWIALLAAAIIPVYAQEEELESDFKTHIIDGGRGLEIIGYVGDKWEVHIPSEINDIPVIRIGHGAFKNHVFITHIIIPNTVTSIEVGAFWGCNILLDIIIPDSVTSIGDEAFSGCSRLTSVTIPKNVTRIGKNAFYDCTDLIRVVFEGTIPSSGFSNFLSFPAFPGNLRSRFYASDRANGTPGTYTRTSSGNSRTIIWIKQR
jgi:hypothetical protein